MLIISCQALINRRICPNLLGFKDWIPDFAGMATCLYHKTLKKCHSSAEPVLVKLVLDLIGERGLESRKMTFNIKPNNLGQIQKMTWT